MTACGCSHARLGDRGEGQQAEREPPSTRQAWIRTDRGRRKESEPFGPPLGWGALGAWGKLDQWVLYKDGHGTWRGQRWLFRKTLSKENRKQV